MRKNIFLTLYFLLILLHYSLPGMSLEHDDKKALLIKKEKLAGFQVKRDQQISYPNNVSTYLFNRPIDVRLSEIIESDASQDSLYFRDRVLLYKNKFQSQSGDSSFNLYNCTFLSGLRIVDCYSNGYLKFNNSSFHGNVNIYNELESSDFLNVEFNNVNFYNGLCFNYLTGYGQKQIAGKVFKDKIYFNDCRIAGTLDFSHCTFDSASTIYFSGYNYIDFIDLSEATIVSSIDLMDIKSLYDTSICKINLTGTDASKIKCQYQKFKLVFPDSLMLSPKDQDAVTSTYEALLANFTKSGFKDSYEKLDIEYQDYKYRRFRIFNIIIPHWWNCYGYHKEWIFYWTFGFLFLFTFITFFSLKGLNKNIEQGGVYYISNIPSHHGWGSAKDILARSWYSFMYTSNIFFHVTLKLENLNFRRLRMLYIVFVYTLGILCLGYIANFVIQK